MSTLKETYSSLRTHSTHYCSLINSESKSSGPTDIRSLDFPTFEFLPPEPDAVSVRVTVS